MRRLVLVAVSSCVMAASKGLPLMSSLSVAVTPLLRVSITPSSPLSTISNFADLGMSPSLRLTANSLNDFGVSPIFDRSVIVFRSDRHFVLRRGVENVDRDGAVLGVGPLGVIFLLADLDEMAAMRAVGGVVVAGMVVLFAVIVSFLAVFMPVIVAAFGRRRRAGAAGGPDGNRRDKAGDQQVFDEYALENPLCELVFTQGRDNVLSYQIVCPRSSASKAN